VSAAVTSPRERTHQKEHAVAPAFEKRFDPQTWQTALEAAARTSEKEPALQSVHNDSEAAACWLPYLPTGQSKHRSVREPRPHPCVSTKYRDHIRVSAPSTDATKTGETRTTGLTGGFCAIDTSIFPFRTKHTGSGCWRAVFAYALERVYLDGKISAFME